MAQDPWLKLQGRIRKHLAVLQRLLERESPPAGDPGAVVYQIDCLREADVLVESVVLALAGESDRTEVYAKTFRILVLCGEGGLYESHE